MPSFWLYFVLFLFLSFVLFVADKINSRKGRPEKRSQLKIPSGNFLLRRHEQCFLYDTRDSLSY